MKCNICGAELDHGETVCKFCGNVVFGTHKEITGSNKAMDAAARRAPEREIRAAAKNRTGDETIIVQTDVPRRKKFCAKCGRPLDITTQRCPVCDEPERQLRRMSETDIRAASVRAQRAAVIKKRKQVKTNFITITVMTLIAMFVITSIFFFRLLGGGETSEETIATEEPAATEEIVTTEEPIIDDSDGEVHWKPTNE